MDIKGNIHSIETFGAVDGPGIRFIVFFQGCPLRCLYCHNPDSWIFSNGKETTSDHMLQTILSYKNFIKNGGVTLSGGEPLFQPVFAKDLIIKCRENGIHTAIDTSGAVPLDMAKPVLDEVDLVLLDIKDIEDEGCIDLTGRSNKQMIDVLNYCESINKPVWIRHVVVPGYTLEYSKLEKLNKFIENYRCIEKVEPLSFHKIGEYKWEQLGEKYKLYDTKEPTDEEMYRVKKILKLI